MRRFCLFALLLLPLVASAQSEDGGSDVLDASIPDASVGEGGADRDQQEAEDTTGRVPQTCRDADDCERRFACEAGRCVYVGVRHAQGGGCLGGNAAALVLVGAFGLALRRRR